MKKHFFYIVFFQVTLFSCKNKTLLFEKIDPEKSGITFSNTLTDSDSLNVLTFEYFYNGGGVGIGDFNGDSLKDVYFTGNQVQNKLYLNKTKSGEPLKFEDITEKSATTGNGRWCSGVAVADVNADGKLDMYVCANVKKSPKDRENLLYINQGNDANGVPQFKEKAKEYGLADTTFSTNAAFFDFDNDGDLDVYILVDKVDKDNSPNRYRKKITDGSAETNDKLYRNDWNDTLKHAVFTDVTLVAGIKIEGFGLGINISDINRDGWKDIYVTNDFLTNDLFWINNKNGTFTDRANELLKHTSSSAMGNDIVDINNDGLADIYALDMLPEDNYRKKMLMNQTNYQSYLNNDIWGFQYQYVRNTLQLNQGVKPNTDQPHFNDISLLAGVGETDWSWCPSIVDFDNDGKRDILVTNGFPKDITDHDFVMFRQNVGSIASPSYMLDSVPQVKIKNYAFRNKSETNNIAFENVIESWGLDMPSFSSGAAYADLDNDGDVDYVVNNINDIAFLYQNNTIENKIEATNYLRINFKGEGQNTQGIGAIIEILMTNGEKQMYENSPFRGYLSTVEAVAHFGLGNVKTIPEIKIIWQNGKQQTLKNIAANQTILVESKNAKIVENETFIAQNTLFKNITDSLKIDYTHNEIDFVDFNVQKLLLHKFSQFGPSLAVGDVNGDGTDDVYVGGSAYKKGKFLVQSIKGGFTEADLLPETDTTFAFENTGSLLIDIDNDNDLDLYLVSGGSEIPLGTLQAQDRIYVNNGKGGFTLAIGSLPLLQKSGSCAKAADFDKDGDLDLFIGGRLIPGSFPKPASSFILRNDSKPNIPKYTDVTSQVAPFLNKLGLVCDAIWSDFDNDGWVDLAIAGEYMPISFLKNEKGKFTNKLQTGIESNFGLWNSISAGDFDNDGDIDYLVGNHGLNSILRANEAEPIKMYGKDFNNDGMFDAIPTAFYLGQDGKKYEYPFHVREDMIRQLNTTRKRFPNFASYAKATINELFNTEELNGSIVLKANYLNTCLLQNNGNGKFEIKSLPQQVQVAPVFGFNIADFDQDGNLDALLVGNDYGAEVNNGRYDAMDGIFLKGDGKGNFSASLSSKSGFYVSGDAKAIVNVQGNKGKSYLFVSQNKGKLQIFTTNKKYNSIVMSKNETYILQKLKNGKSRKIERYFGNSFYSQSSSLPIL